MAMNPATPVRSVNSGEIDPDAHSRVDIKQYYSGAAAMKNVEPVPQSGFRLMGGTKLIGRQRGPLATIAVTSPTLSAGPHTDTQTVWTGTVADRVAVVVVAGLAYSAGTGSFTVEALVGASWVAIAPAFIAGTTAVTRTAAFAPQEGQVATSIRIRASFSESATVSLGSVAVWSEGAANVDPRFVALNLDDGTRLLCSIGEAMFDAFTDEGHAGAAFLALNTAAMLPDLDFYAEADTIGIFHASGVATQRLRRISGNHDWSVDSWPYQEIPEVDLGGNYAKTSDVWQIFVRWATATPIFLSVTVNGESTAGIPLLSTEDTLVNVDNSLVDFDGWAAAIQAAIIALPNMETGVTVTASSASIDSSRVLTVTFGGAASGVEYDLNAVVVNTTEASALPNHEVVGKTAGEPLFSAGKGYPGTVELVQDRQAYARLPARKGAMALSAVADYFNLNIIASSDAAARLDNIRSVTSETILSVKESKYMLAFTDRAVYFANNRTIERNQPLNFVKTSETGIRINTKAIDLDGQVYYLSNNGQQLISLAYDDVNTSFVPNPESLLASHLISEGKRTARQIAEQKQDASKMWILREDGRLIAAQAIRNQEIIGFCEWRLPDGGQAREIAVDADNRMWLATKRGADRFIELYEQNCLYQAALVATSDIAGVVAGLDALEGRTVWAEAQDYVLGPFTVTGGEIDLGDPYSGDVTVGLWIAPVFESMPQPLIVPQDDIVFRPGRIHTAHINVIETTSIAVGANGEPARDVPLTRTGDPVDTAPPERTELVSIYGMLGNQTGPRLTITQTKPGKLRVRDLAMEAKL
jgi:hypothetical protein